MLLQERLLTSPSGLTLNTQQTNAVLELEEWWKEVSRIPRRSTFIHRLMNRPEGKRTAIALAAPTHKAKTVLVDMAIENNIYGCKITTMASLLGVKADLDAMGEDEFKFNIAKLKIDGFDLVLADESSMCNVKQWEYIKSLDICCPPMILIGDIEQLRPVKGADKSPVFQEVKRWINLSEPFRYGGRIKDLVICV